MATFSVNQVKQLYIANKYNATTVTESSDEGTIGDVKVLGSGNNKELVFKFKGADTVLTSDRIKVKNIDYVKAIDASKMAVKLKKVEVTLNSDVNGGAPVSGQDYVLRIEFREWAGPDEKYTYIKSAAVHATSSMSASDFYKEMVKQLNLAFAREIGATKTSNPYLEFSVDNDTTATKIVIEEKEQEWTLGTQAQERVYFLAQPTTIYVAGDDVIWGEAKEVAGTITIKNGKKIADLEYFAAGERGDQYRNMGWPNVITTKYLADATKEYHVLEIHYAFTDEGVNSYNSEKDITIASTDKAVINSLIDKINGATSLGVEKLATA